MAEIPSAVETEPPDRLELLAQRADQAWRRLGLRLRSVTPGSLAQFGLLIGALAIIG